MKEPPYEKSGEWYDMKQFEGQVITWEEYLIPARKCLYDHVIIDPSDPEKEFVEGLEKRDDVKLYVKLPPWFTVPTPIGEYNPDWAIVIESRDAHGRPTGEEHLYLIRETKSTTDPTKLRIGEMAKTRYGKRHFHETLGVDYKVITRIDEL